MVANSVFLALYASVQPSFCRDTGLMGAFLGGSCAADCSPRKATVARRVASGKSGGVVGGARFWRVVRGLDDAGAY